MENYFNNKSIFVIINKWKYHILAITVIAGILGAVFSSPFFVKPLFKSTAVLYPANLTSMSEESETEQLLQILQSQEIRNRIFDKFELGNHYEIEKDHEHFKTILNKEFEDHVSFRKTEYESVEIEVLDISPDTAAFIASELILLYNNKVRDMHRGKYKETAKMFKSQMQKKSEELDSLEAILDTLRQKYSLLDYKIQARELTSIIAEGKEKGDAKEIFEALKEKGGKYLKTDSLFKMNLSLYQNVKKAYEVAKVNLEKEITYAHVVSRPYPADKKSYPIRWLIVLFSMIGGIFMGMFTITIVESIKKKQ